MFRLSFEPSLDRNVNGLTFNFCATITAPDSYCPLLFIIILILILYYRILRHFRKLLLIS